MRKAILLSVALLCISISFAQTSFNYQIKVRDKRGKLLNGVQVWMTESKSGQKITKNTNGSGLVNFELNTPGKWSVNLPGLPNYEELEIKDGSQGGGGATITYDLEAIKSEQAILKARPNTKFELIDQTSKSINFPSKGFAVIQIKVIGSDKRKVKDADVFLVSPKQAIRYKSNTSYLGMAKFFVPIGHNYAIDIGEVENIGFTQKIHSSGIVTITKVYDQPNVAEKNKNDTIVQQVTAMSQPNMARFFVEINIMKQGNIPFGRQSERSG